MKSQAHLLRAMRRRLINRDSKVYWQDRGLRNPDNVNSEYNSDSFSDGGKFTG